MEPIPDSLVFSIYLAALQPSRWPAVVRAMTERAGVDALSILAMHRARIEPVFAASNDISPDIARALREHCLGHFARAAGPWHGHWRHRFDEVASLGGAGRFHRAGVVVGDGSGLRVAICLAQGEDLGPVTDQALGVAAHLGPHVLYALSLRRQDSLPGDGSTRLPDAANAGTFTESRRIDRAGLVMRYGFTERELAVCEHFLNLASVEDTARVLGVEVSTVRFHLKSIYGKTGLRSLPALMRLLAEGQRPPPGAPAPRGRG